MAKINLKEITIAVGLVLLLVSSSIVYGATISTPDGDFTTVKTLTETDLNIDTNADDYKTAINQRFIATGDIGGHGIYIYDWKNNDYRGYIDDSSASSYDILQPTNDLQREKPLRWFNESHGVTHNGWIFDNRANLEYRLPNSHNAYSTAVSNKYVAAGGNLYYRNNMSYWKSYTDYPMEMYREYLLYASGSDDPTLYLENVETGNRIGSWQAEGAIGTLTTNDKVVYKSSFGVVNWYNVSSGASGSFSTEYYGQIEATKNVIIVGESNGNGAVYYDYSGNVLGSEGNGEEGAVLGWTLNHSHLIVNDGHMSIDGYENYIVKDSPYEIYSGEDVDYPFSTQYDIDGYVETLKGDAIENAKISISDKSTTTDASGYYSINDVFEGQKDIDINHTEYINKTKTIDISQSNTRFNHTLDYTSNLNVEKTYINNSESINYTYELSNRYNVNNDVDTVVTSNNTNVDINETTNNIIGNTSNTGYSKVTAQYTDVNGKTYTDEVTIFIDNRKLEITTPKKFLNNSESQNYTVKYDGNDVTNTKNLTVYSNNNLLNIQEIDNNVVSNQTGSGYANFYAEYKNNNGAIVYAKKNLSIGFETNLNIGKQFLNNSESTTISFKFDGNNVLEHSNTTITRNNSLISFALGDSKITADNTGSGTTKITGEYKDSNGVIHTSTENVFIENRKLRINVNKSYLDNDDNSKYEVTYGNEVISDHENLTVYTGSSILTVEESINKIISSNSGSGYADVYAEYINSNNVTSTALDNVSIGFEANLNIEKNYLNNSERTNISFKFDGNEVLQNDNTYITKNNSYVEFALSNGTLKADSSVSGIVTITGIYEDENNNEYKKSENVYIENRKLELNVLTNYLANGDTASYSATYGNEDISNSNNLTVSTIHTNLISIDEATNTITASNTDSGYVVVNAEYTNSNGITSTTSSNISVGFELDLTVGKEFLNHSEKTSINLNFSGNNVLDSNRATTYRNNSLIDIDIANNQIQAVDTGGGVVKISSEYTDDNGVYYSDSKEVFVEYRKLQINLEQDYLENGDIMNYTITYGNNDVTSNSNTTTYTNHNSLIKVNSNATIRAKNNGDGYPVIVAEYKNKFGVLYTTEKKFRVNTKYLSIRTTDYLKYNESAEYIIRYGGEIVTNKSSIGIKISNNNLLNDSSIRNEFIATNNKSIDGTVSITINYTDKYGYKKEIKHEIFVGNRTIENIDELPPSQGWITLLQNEVIRALIFVIFAGVGATMLVNAYAGIAGVTLAIAIGFIGGVFSLGYFVMVMISGIFIFLNTDIRFNAS